MPDEEYTPEEAERRARAVARRMLNTPPQPKKKAPQNDKTAAKPDRARAAKSGKRGQAGEAS